MDMIRSKITTQVANMLKYGTNTHVRYYDHEYATEETFVT